jgi:hydrogenase expression/formation protein HypC
MCLAIPGRLISRSTSEVCITGLIDFGGIQREVCLDFIPDLAVGEWATIHVGFAINRIDEQQALQTLRDIAAMEAGSDPLHSLKDSGSPDKPVTDPTAR